MEIKQKNNMQKMDSSKGFFSKTNDVKYLAKGLKTHGFEWLKEMKVLFTKVNDYKEKKPKKLNLQLFHPKQLRKKTKWAHHKGAH